MKLRLISFAFIAALLAVPASAQVGDPAAGATKIVTCQACHGTDGKGILPIYPNLGGQGFEYLVKQIHDIKDNVRPVLEMQAFVATLSDQDIADIAAYYADQPHQITGSQPLTNDAWDLDSEAFLALGEQIYRNGNMETGVPACSGCHSPSGMGNDPAGFPVISGQQYDYLAKQLRDFRGNVRVNDGDNMWMRAVAKRLSDVELEAVANYISGLN